MWSGVRMTAVRTPLRPSRRSLLLSGALLGTLGLAGCDGVSRPWSPPPRATVALAPLTTAKELQPEKPVFRSDWAISPTAERPMALLVRREKSLETDLRAVTLAEPEGVPVPVDPGSTSVVVDGHGETVRVYATRVEGGARRTTMHTSVDLTEWASIEVGGMAGPGVAAAGDGLVVAPQRDGELQLWGVGEGGDASPLTPIAVPGGERWAATSIARAEETLLVVVERTGTEEETVVVSSADGGASWSEPATLPGDGDDRAVHAALAVDGSFVLVGSWRASVEWDGHRRTTRAAAWTGTGVEDLREEDVPLPLWGLENFRQEKGRGSLAPDTPIDFTDLAVGPPVRSAEGAEVCVTTFWGDDVRVLRRAADGTWSAGDSEAFASAYVIQAVGDTTGALLRTDDGVHARASGSAELIGLRADPSRGLSISAGATGAGITGRITWNDHSITRTDEEITWRSPLYGTDFGADEEDRLVLRTGLRIGNDTPREAIVHRLDGDLTLCTGMVPDDDASGRFVLAAVVSTDHSTWQEVSGLKGTEDDASVGAASTVDGVHHLPIAEWIEPEGGGPAVLTPSLYRSTDGIAWESVPPPVPDHPEPELTAAGARIEVMTAVDGVLIALGAVLDAEETHRPAIFVQDGEGWTTVPVEGAVAGDALSGIGDDGVHGSMAGRALRWTLAADGTLTETYRSDDRSSRGPALDLGEGALIAGGWIDVPAAEDEDEGVETGIGACVWASRDAGETWQRTMLPGQEGRFPEVYVRAEGDGVLVILDDPDVPHGYRIRDARLDVLGETVEG